MTGPEHSIVRLVTPTPNSDAAAWDALEVLRTRFRIAAANASMFDARIRRTKKAILELESRLEDERRQSEEARVSVVNSGDEMTRAYATYCDAVERARGELY